MVTFGSPSPGRSSVAVVIDATERILWVSKGPHALGEYIGFDLRRELGDVSRPQPSPLPEDPVLHSPEYRNFQMMGQSLHAAEVARKHDQPELAIEEARRAVGLISLPAWRAWLAEQAAP